MSGYITYNSGTDVSSLDLNTVNGNDATIFPNRLYDGQAFPQSQYVCESGPRNTDYDYLINMERASHPDHFSRFGYGNCWNGYCSGHWPGRYNTDPNCRMQNEMEQPPDMAPPRFYTDGKFTSPFYPDSPAYTVSRVSRAFR